MRIFHDEIARTSLPGQFINIRVSNNMEPFWRRPFSIHATHADEHWFDILYRVIGIGTQKLAFVKSGEIINFVGPLGNHFIADPAITKTSLLVGGGLGIAPMVILAHYLIQRNIHPIVFYGVRSQSELCSLPDLQALTSDIYIATEDGSVGQTGYITESVDAFLRQQTQYNELNIYACGPNPMLDRLGQIAELYHVPCQVSLETLMGCGIGACLGCGMKTRNSEKPYVYVCKEGPVFQAGEIDFSE